MGAAAPVVKFAQALAQWLHSASRSSQLLEQPSFPLLSAPAQVAALARLPISTVRLLTRPARRCRTSPPTHQTPQVSPTLHCPCPCHYVQPSQCNLSVEIKLSLLLSVNLLRPTYVNLLRPTYVNLCTNASTLTFSRRKISKNISSNRIKRQSQGINPIAN